MNKTERDRLSALFWLAAAAGVCYGSVKLSLGSLRQPGPGLFSFYAGAVLGTFSFIVFVKSLKIPTGEDRKAFWSSTQRGQKMIYVLIALIFYAIGMNYLGFFLSTFLFLAFLLRGIEPQRWPVVFLVAISGSVVSFGIFKYWFATSSCYDMAAEVLKRIHELYQAE